MTSILEHLALSRVKQRFPNLRRKGFETAIRKVLRGELGDERIGLIPDGWLHVAREIEDGGDLFVALEIEDRNTLSARKLWLYCNLFDTLDFYDIELQLLVFDRYGQSQRMLDLPRLYYEMLAQASGNFPTDPRCSRAPARAR